MIKLVASDLDGTLLKRPATSLNPEIFEIVKELQAKGIPFISASGRPIQSQKTLWGPIADQISYVGENGALCLLHNKPYVVSYLDTTLAFRMIHEISKNPECKILVSCPTQCYILESDMEFRDYVDRHLQFDIGLVKDFSEITEPIVKVAYNHKDGWPESLLYYKEMFAGEAVVVSSGNNWVDLMPLTCNKAEGLKLVLDKLGIPAEDVMAFGDQQNDMEMLSFVGHSYAMESGVPETKAIAKHITDSVEKTLREFLKTL